MAASLVAAQEISVEAAADAFLAQLGDIFTRKEEQKTTQKLLCERMFWLHSLIQCLLQPLAP